MSIPILMTVWLLEFSVTSAVLGVVVTVGYTLFGVGALPGGVLVDRYSSRMLIAGCLLGMGTAFLLLGFASTIGTITVALAAWGLAASVYHPAGLALISNGATKPGTAFAYHGVAGNVGTAFGPLATALLLLLFEWRTVAILLAIPALVAAVAGLIIEFDEWAASNRADKAKSTRIQSLSEFATSTRQVFTVGFILILVVITFDGLYYRGVLTFLPELLGEFLSTFAGNIQTPTPNSDPIAENFDLAQYVYVGLLTVGIGGQYIGGKLVNYIEPERGLIAALTALIVISLVFVPAAEAHFLTLFFVTGLLGFALFAMQPLTQATIAKYSSPESRGLAFGYTYLAAFGVGAVGATIVGVVLAYASVFLVFIVLATFAVAGLVCSSMLAGLDQ
jgi:MFS family permease